MSDQILLCYDGSEGSRRAIDAAGALVSHRRGLVLNVGPPLGRAEHVLAVPGMLDFAHVNAPAAQTLAEEGAEYARRAGFEAVAQGGVAAPTWEAIVNFADEIEAALIVLGSGGLNGLGKLVKGSVSHRVAEHARRAVFIVPSHDDD